MDYATYCIMLFNCVFINFIVFIAGIAQRVAQHAAAAKILISFKPLISLLKTQITPTYLQFLRELLQSTIEIRGSIGEREELSTVARVDKFCTWKRFIFLNPILSSLTEVNGFTSCFWKVGTQITPLVSRPLLKDGGNAEDHGASEAGQLHKI